MSSPSEAAPGAGGRASESELPAPLQEQVDRFVAQLSDKLDANKKQDRIDTYENDYFDFIDHIHDYLQSVITQSESDAPDASRDEALLEAARAPKETAVRISNIVCQALNSRLYRHHSSTDEEEDKNLAYFIGILQKCGIQPTHFDDPDGWISRLSEDELGSLSAELGQVAVRFMDMNSSPTAHGKLEQIKTALLEITDVLKQYYKKDVSMTELIPGLLFAITQVPAREVEFFSNLRYIYRFKGAIEGADEYTLITLDCAIGLFNAAGLKGITNLDLPNMEDEQVLKKVLGNLASPITTLWGFLLGLNGHLTGLVGAGYNVMASPLADLLRKKPAEPAPAVNGSGAANLHAALSQLVNLYPFGSGPAPATAAAAAVAVAAAEVDAPSRLPPTPLSLPSSPPRASVLNPGGVVQVLAAPAHALFALGSILPSLNPIPALRPQQQQQQQAVTPAAETDPVAATTATVESNRSPPELAPAPALTPPPAPTTFFQRLGLPPVTEQLSGAPAALLSAVRYPPAALLGLLQQQQQQQQQQPGEEQNGAGEDAGLHPSASAEKRT